jgi:hypothetical protein
MKALRVIDADAARAAHRHRLQVLRAHDGADAGAPGGPVQVVDDAGVAHPALARDADRGDLHLRLLVVGFQPAFRVPHGGAPDIVGGQDLDGLVDDLEVDRPLGPALDDQQVVAGELELGAELAAGVGAGDGAGERALGDHHIAPDVEAMVPVSGPVAKISTLSGDMASTAGSMVSHRYLVASPRAPA